MFNPGMGLPGEATMRGHAEARASVEGPGHAGIANKEQHVMANLVIEVDGDAAQAIGHLVLTLHNWGGFSIGTCRYVHMNFRREQGRWRISQLTFRETGDAECGRYIVESGLLSHR
jgi:ketosteroid isomerase-like protein